MILLSIFSKYKAEMGQFKMGHESRPKTKLEDIGLNPHTPVQQLHVVCYAEALWAH